jgi:FkbM family methyltransferase
MSSIIRRVISRLTNKQPNIQPHESEKWARMSYAQEGEDLVLDRLLEGVQNGFYVDVGSHHPFRFSNTYLFYCRGWKGICIDPLPGTVQLFARWRPKDIAIELGVSETGSQLRYYMFNEPAMNTFDPVIAKERDGLSQYKIIDEKQVETKPLSTILDQYMDSEQHIDILTVDVEGLDLQVLRSNDWSKYRPKYVVAECLETDFMKLLNDPLVAYLKTQEYRAYAKTGHSVIFIR